MTNPINVLVSAYACGPNWGSEIGMGWNWVINLSNFCQLTIITEFAFKKEIEGELSKFNLKYNPKFYYLDIGERGRILFWKQGSFLFYWYYKRWQRKALTLSKVLIHREKFDIIHQLNMIGFREPGYLWRIDTITYIWGPVGGYNQVPWAYLIKMGAKNALYYSIKNIINEFQISILDRPKKAASRATIVFAANYEAAQCLRKHVKTELITLNETGCKINKFSNIATTKPHNNLKILWVGRIQGLKALPIAIESLSILKNEYSFTFTIIGDGPDKKSCMDLAHKKGLFEKCVWKGRLAHNEVISAMLDSDLLFFTSLKEGTPHVVTEAIENGLPVLCHDTCGQGAVINENCGVKIPMINYTESVIRFAQEISKLAKNPKVLTNLSRGALERASELTWNLKAEFLYQKYLQVTSANEKVG